MRGRILCSEPDVVCLTESFPNFLEGGHVIEADPDYGYPITPGRRKLLLWSKCPWSRVDQIGHAELRTGRFVRGTTRTPTGELDVIGVYIPWSGAHVASGQRDKAPWEDHLRFLEVLRGIITPGLANLVVLGDFNQAFP